MMYQASRPEAREGVKVEMDGPGTGLGSVPWTYDLFVLLFYRA